MRFLAVLLLLAAAQSLLIPRTIHSRHPISNELLSNNAIKLFSTAPAAPASPEMNSSTTMTTSIPSISRLIIRTAWISWWFQIILSVISGVILTFANTVRSVGITNSGNALVLPSFSSSFWTSGFAFSSIGVFISFINCGWTWNITRLIRRILGGKIKGDKTNIVATIRKYCRISVIISLIGQLFTLLGAEQIVGTLASKVLSNSSNGMFPVIQTNGYSTLQALDIFLVQANTNLLVGFYVPLLLFVWVQTQLPK
jgi:hypothetical protein